MKEEQIRDILRDSGADIIAALKALREICRSHNGCWDQCPFRTTRPGHFCDLEAVMVSLDIERIRNDINNYI